ncbi:MAG TPA: hypothetical protein P5257_03215 [Bacteroidales bacterium]|nr:hypothetical protein [Bacteroidales bacterium]HRR93501.1 hypothetical protein [Bacteroidales bacterium]HRT89105.1 hypothetical protein [Bacteroidales bacterium]
MKTIKYFLIFSVIAAFILAGCESLEVKNENDPDFATAFSNPSDVKGVASSLINAWFMITQNYDGPALALWVGADAGTCSWGNAAMRDFSYEPRRAWDNTPSYGNAVITENYYKTLYSILSSANEVVGKIKKDNLVITSDNGTDETPMVQAVGHLVQGLSLGYVGLLFDKAFIVTESTNLTETVPVSGYKEVIDTAVACLDKCIAICAAKTFELPTTWVPGIVMTNTKLSELANTVAAVLLSYSPRNKTENDAVDWAKVLAYANKGLTYDFAPKMDDITWYTSYHTYANYSGWGMTDMRIVNMMDSRFPSRWVDANTWNILPTPVTSHTAGIDDRIFTDFQYMSSCGFRVERGYYHFSCYRFKRRDTYLSTWTEPAPVFYKAENDLLKAEALSKKSSPDLAAAAAIINSGTRVTRGGLAPVSADATEIENAIFYERNIELFCSGVGVEFFTMRKANKLQSGTPLHFPIPGQQLEVNLMDYYSFGPGQGVAGQDYSNGGWFK